MPDLSNVHFLERGLNWSTLAYVVFLCLAAGTSFLLAIFAGRVTAAKDDELKRIASTSAEAVANAHAGAARAHAQAALAFKDQRLVEAEMERGKAHRELLRKENLELQLTVEKERAARLQLEERLGSRHIGAAQRQSMQSGLAAFQGQAVTVITHPGDPEIAAFAADLKASLEASGIKATLTPALVFGNPQAGLSFEVGIRRRQFAAALAKALVEAGVCSGPITATESDTADLVEITVGPKK